MKILAFISGMLLLVSGFVYLDRAPYNYSLLTSGILFIALYGFMKRREVRRERSFRQDIAAESEEGFSHLVFTIDPDLLEIRPYTATYENEHYDDSLSQVNDLGVLYGLSMFNSEVDVLKKQYDSQPGVLIAYEQELEGNRIRFREFVPLDEITFKMKLYTNGSNLHVKWKSKEQFKYFFELID